MKHRGNTSTGYTMLSRQVVTWKQFQRVLHSNQNNKTVKTLSSFNHMQKRFLGQDVTCKNQPWKWSWLDYVKRSAFSSLHFRHHKCDFDFDLLNAQLTNMEAASSVICCPTRHSARCLEPASISKMIWQIPMAFIPHLRHCSHKICPWCLPHCPWHRHSSSFRPEAV